MAISLMAMALSASVCRAQDCGPTPYAYEDRVILLACNKAGIPELRVIVLDDAGPLKITSRISSTAKRSFDAAAHYNNFLLVLTWNHLEVFDIGDPALPTLAAKYDLKDQEKLQGYSRIEKSGVDKFLVMCPTGAAELTMEGEAPKWILRAATATPEMRKQMTQPPPELRLTNLNEGPAIIRETTQFRYELISKDRTKPGEVWHRRILRKIDKGSQRTVSELALGAIQETID